MDEYLKLNDGTILENSKARQSDDTLFVYIEDGKTDFVTAFGLLSNKGNVQKIIYHYHKAELIFEGFTRLISLQDDDKRIIAVLKREGEN